MATAFNKPSTAPNSFKVSCPSGTGKKKDSERKALLFTFLLISSFRTTSVASFLPSYHTPSYYPPTAYLPRRMQCFTLFSENKLSNNESLQGKKGGRSSVRKKRKSRRGDKTKHDPPGSLKGSSGRQTWRVFGVEVSPDSLASTTPSIPAPGSSKTPSERAYLTRPVMEALMARLKIKTPEKYDMADSDNEYIPLPKELIDARVVRRSLDARKNRRNRGPTNQAAGEGPRYNYVIDIDMASSIVRKLHFKHQPGRLELMSKLQSKEETKAPSDQALDKRKPIVVIVGAGPAGLFCALKLARSGKVSPIVVERGQAVESRGKDIGALMHRRTINKESNFAFGEGGAGTWSDGKLTTRIGRNSDNVRFVLETFVEYGAPEKILVDGAPHLGTDNLVRLLRNMRRDLRELGGEVRFGARMTKVHQSNGAVTGIDVAYVTAIERGEIGPKTDFEGTETITADAVVLATGHSARDVYEELAAQGVQLEAKGFATGFRVEHPQSLINKIQYGTEWGPSVITGKGRTDKVNLERFETMRENDSVQDEPLQHIGQLPVSSYRLATDKAFDGETNRGAYSFCMCPGGQIVPASTDPNEACVNGMSFSRRDSQWANSALVVTIAPDDPVLDKYRAKHGVLAGLAFQRDMEQRAAMLGGGDFVVPVQRLTDFVDGRPSVSAPSSSYRLGVKPAACHEIYPQEIVNSLKDAVTNHFDKQMPGFFCDEGLLHAVETRTSSPVRITRDPISLQANGVKNLFPAGEGAGFAGGIVSAAVDGIVVAESVLEEIVGMGAMGEKKKSKSIGFEY